MPNPPEKQKSAAQKWGEELNGAEAPVDGIDREMLRKAMALNPRMKKEEGGTQRVIEKLEKANAQRPLGEQAAADDGRVGLVDGIEQHKKRFYEEQQRLKQEITKLEKQLKDLVPATQERVTNVFVQHDPNMSNPLTAEIMKAEARFFSDVQFTARKVLEALQRRKR